MPARSFLPAVIPLLLVSCGAPALPSPPTVLELTPRYLDVEPYTTRTFDVRVTRGSAPTALRTSGVPSGVTVSFEGARGTVKAGAVTPGAYAVTVQGDAASTNATQDAGGAVLDVFVPFTGHLLNEPTRPRDEELDVDAARAVHVTVPPSGTTVTLTDATGTPFTLTFPPHAVLENRHVSLTPVATTGVAGSNASYAVQILPDDLQLYKAATLKVLVRPSERPEHHGVFVGWSSRSDGRAFHYAPVKVLNAEPVLTVSGGGVYGVAWTDPSQLDSVSIPSWRADARAARFWRSPDLESRRLTEHTYWTQLMTHLHRPALTAQAVERLLPEVSFWADDVQRSAYDASFRGNVGLAWAALADVALGHAASHGGACAPNVERALFQRWADAADVLPDWKRAMGTSGVQVLRAAACRDSRSSDVGGD